MTIAYKRIAADIYNQSPNQPYLAFLKKELFPTGLRWDNLDPLVIENDMLDLEEDLSIAREAVEQEILPPVPQIIIGPSGSGKSTLVRILSRRLSEKQNVLVVNLSLRSSTTMLDSNRAAWESPLTPSKLSWHIFNTFWEQFFLLNHSNNQTLLPLYLQNETWMRKLRWFYQHFEPHHPNSDHFLLMTWIRCGENYGPQQTGYDPVLILKDLIDFVTQPVPNSILHKGRRFERIVVTIDNTETLSTPQFHQIMEELANLSDLEIPSRFCTKLFLNNSHQPSLAQVRNIHSKIYYLPRWSAQELEDILKVRKKVFEPGEFELSSQWIYYLCRDHIKSLPKDEPVKMLISASQSIYEKNDAGHLIHTDAPVHLLKLTRGILAACAGSWIRYGLSLNFELKDFSEIIRHYWELSEEKE